MAAPQQTTDQATMRWKQWIGVAAFLMASLVFLGPANLHSGGLWNLMTAGSPRLFLFLSPCIIFLITTLAYYKFIVEYTGPIAGVSVAGLLAALFCCEQLSLADQNNWAAHLFWMYCLFYSYVAWDALMLGYFLPGQTTSRAADDKHEIITLSKFINQPTLATLLLMWFTAKQLPKNSAADYVDGVVGFHLVFASLACLRNMRAWWK